MKNTRMIFTALAVALTLGAIPMHADSAMDKFKDKVKAFRKCVSGKKKCTRRESVVAGAAVTAAIAALVFASYKAAPYVQRAGWEKTAAGMARPGTAAQRAAQIARQRAAQAAKGLRGRFGAQQGSMAPSDEPSN